jgi:hypothetical protein
VNVNFTVIITSAAVGAIAGSLITFIGGILERRARRREMLLTKAVELAIHRFESAIRVANETNRSTTLQDPAMMSADYFRTLEHILDKGVPPEEMLGVQRQGPQ